MERIQEAIEKARNERGSIPNDISVPISTLKENANAKKAISIDYIKTRSIKFSDEELKKRRIVAGIAHDPLSEPYRQLRSQLLKKMRNKNWRTLAITSPNYGSGKTLTAINLAISISKEVNQTVMLVDLDLRKPSIAQTLGLDNIEKGIADCIAQNTSLEEILINPDYDRLVIVPGTPQGQHTSEILSSPAMRQLQEELYNRYEDRLIIYDLPPLLCSDDAIVFAPNVDATLLVIEDGGSSKQDLERSVNLLKDANIIGSVVNKLR